MGYQYLLTEVTDGVGVLTLDHPQTSNALGWQLHGELLDALDRWRHDDAVSCALLIGTEDHFCSGSSQVKYAMNGFYHGLLRKVGSQRARRMLFTGDPIDAAEAYRVGMVDKLGPYGTLRDRAMRLARQIAEMGPELAVVLKQVALRASNMDHVGALAYELSVTHDLTQRGLFQRRHAEGLARLKAGESRATERLTPGR